MTFFLLVLVHALLAASADIRFTNDHPVELLSCSKIYQIKQMIIVPNNQSYWNREHPTNFQNTVQIAPIFKDFFHAAFKLYEQVPVLNSSFAPADALNGNFLSHCAVVMSVFNYYFQSFWSYTICTLVRLVKSLIVLAMLARGRPLWHCYHISVILLLISHATAFIQPMSIDKDLSEFDESKWQEDGFVQHLREAEKEHEKAALEHKRMAQQLKLFRLKLEEQSDNSMLERSGLSKVKNASSCNLARILTQFSINASFTTWTASFHSICALLTSQAQITSAECKVLAEAFHNWAFNTTMELVPNDSFCGMKNGQLQEKGPIPCASCIQLYDKANKIAQHFALLFNSLELYCSRLEHQEQRQECKEHVHMTTALINDLIYVNLNEETAKNHCIYEFHCKDNEF